MKRNILIVVIINLTVLFVKGQNTTITDSASYLPHPSAMLDISSTTKGMLVPRLTSNQRMTINNPATGLLIFDLDSVSFYFYNGSSWQNLSTPGATTNNIWTANNDKVFLKNQQAKVGIGTNNPVAKLTVAGDAGTSVNDTLFVVRNKDGEPVFAVFPEGVHVWMEDGAKSNIGGFAVSGRTAGKSLNEYFRVTTDSVRIYIDEIEKKGNIGGFAVSGRTTGKLLGTEILTVTIDSTRINTADPFKGFEINNISGQKNNYIRFSPLNYFVGSKAGSKINLYDTANNKNNLFIGEYSGYNMYSGKDNVFIGHLSGYNTNHSTPGPSGISNVFIGTKAGKANTTGYQNVYIGTYAGASASGADNVFIGSSSGNNTTSGANTFIGAHSGISGSYGFNVCIGNSAGMNASGSNNLFIGCYAGYNNPYSNRLYIENNHWAGTSDSTQALIYGDFAEDRLHLNAKVKIRDIMALDRSFQSNITAGGTIIADKSFIIVKGATGPVTLGSTAISNGLYIGQILILQGYSGTTYYVTVPDGSNTNLQSNFTLEPDDNLFLLWDGSNWTEIARSNN